MSLPNARFYTKRPIQLNIKDSGGIKWYLFMEAVNMMTVNTVAVNTVAVNIVVSLEALSKIRSTIPTSGTTL